MQRGLFTFFLTLIVLGVSAQKYTENETFNYADLIAAYSDLDSKSTWGSLVEIGQSDIGKPIHIFIISKSGKTSPMAIKKANKGIVFINNGIHAGETCGIDASLELAKSLCDPKNPLSSVLEDLVVVLVPVYNVGGMLNRGSYSRANQNGPEEYGFRGNGQNLDLNRDFIKCDSKNAAALNRVFSSWDPDLFIDTHTTNGSDHQYTLTLIASQIDKTNPIIAEYREEQMLPSLFARMKARDMEITPYVYSIGESPDAGIKAFMESPRFSSGYANLFSCFSFITEAHVFKPYSSRVRQTLAFLEEILAFSAKNKSEIIAARLKSRDYERNQQTFPLKWVLDTSRYEMLDFRGYEYKVSNSKLTGGAIGKYNQENPYKKEIRYYNRYKETASAKKPKFYFLPQAYTKVIDRLTWNNIEFERLKSDSLMELEVYYIEHFESPEKPYEGHFLHREVELRKEQQLIQLYAGDLVISSDQKNVRYLMEVLEPQGVDSYFAWNFFDASLQQKEYFSTYAFEPKAKLILENSPQLKADFTEKKKKDPDFASDNYAQLKYIYEHSPHFEKSAFRYPVFRKN